MCSPDGGEGGRRAGKAGKAGKAGRHAPWEGTRTCCFLVAMVRDGRVYDGGRWGEEGGLGEGKVVDGRGGDIGRAMTGEDSRHPRGLLPQRKTTAG